LSAIFVVGGSFFYSVTPGNDPLSFISGIPFLAFASPVGPRLFLSFVLIQKKVTKEKIKKMDFARNSSLLVAARLTVVRH